MRHNCSLVYGSVTLLVLVFFGCVPPVDEIITTVDIDISSPTYKRLYEHIDSRQVDSILAYTSHPDPAYRYTMATGFASIKSMAAIDSLTLLLDDPVLRVRTAAAYALGQQGSPSVVTPLVEAFKRKDTIDVDNSFNAAILEAIGKTADRNLLNAIATVSTYRNTDTLLLTGQAMSIYRFGLRGLFAGEATQHMVDLLLDDTNPPMPRLYAAKYLSRFGKKLSLEEYSKRLGAFYVKAPSGALRTALAPAVVRLGDPLILETVLERAADTELDYRERVEILRVLGSYPYIQVVDPVLALLADDNLHVAHAAAGYLSEYGSPSDAALYRNYMKPDMRYSVKAKMYSAILNKIPVYFTNTKSKFKRELLALIDSSEVQTEKIEYYRAYAKDPYSYPELLERLAVEQDPPVRSAITQGLADIVQSDNFIRAYSAGLRYHTKQIVAALNNALATGDAGVVAIVGNALSSDKVDFVPYIKDSLNYYTQVQSSLSMPGHIESYNEMAKVIAKITDRTYQPTPIQSKHPIDWSYLINYGDSAVAVIKTSKGNIKIRLAVADAPVGVANFIGLALDDYFDGKTVHRVVSNFVIQGGCSRGDGYGGLNYTVSSEYSQQYYDGPGYVGMASAGPDTEGTQWFITHSAAPHLDGRYTIIGRVVEGMDAVHKIMPGDITYDVLITKG